MHHHSSCWWYLKKNSPMIDSSAAEMTGGHLFWTSVKACPWATWCLQKNAIAGSIWLPGGEPRAVEHLTRVDAPGHDLLMSRLNVGDDQPYPERARRGVRDSLANEIEDPEPGGVN
jgi:hypothetical protein